LGRTILLGLDGATFSILDALIDSGIMPTLGAQIKRGVRGVLQSTIPPVTFPAFTSMMTGRSPGYHGIFDFVQPKDYGAGIHFELNRSDDIRCETIWSIVSRHERPVICLNFPMTYPQRPLLGAGIPGFVSLRHLRRNVYPPELYDRLQKLPGFSPRELAMDLDLEKKSIQGISREEAEAWVDLHRRREQQLFNILSYLMVNIEWSLLAVVFDGVDKIQHAFWRLIDENNVIDDGSTWESSIKRACMEYFKQIDDFLEEIIVLAGEDARVFIVSDHGFGPTTEIFYVNVWLHQHGYLHWSDDGHLDEIGQLTVDRLKRHVTLLDWQRTVAYALTPSSNGIYIRVSRESGEPGIPPEEYERFRHELKTALLGFTDPIDGGQVVTRVLTREEAFPGSAMYLAPDLTLELRDGGFVSILNADAALKSRTEVAGTHRPDGIFVASGQGVREDAVIEPLSILDVAPTILYSLDVPVPSDFEGRVVSDVFTPTFLKTQPMRSAGQTLSPDGLPAVRDERAKETLEDLEIMTRLRALGYFE
jgi:predicted AlkP superfamily phosphohydrolase/phosphomutase